jgi:hypothetical protein
LSLPIFKDKTSLTKFNQILNDCAIEKQNHLKKQGIEFLNSCELCAVCLQSPNVDNDTQIVEPLIKHHIRYFPQKIAYVHNRCHQQIHSNENTLSHFIQYDDGDSNKFYKIQHVSKSKYGVVV